MTAESTIDIHHLLCSWEEDRKLVLRGWCLVFISLATLMLFSVVDGRMVYLHGSYDGFLGFWINCRKFQCAEVGQVTVFIHMSNGFIFLAMALCPVLLASMFLSFWPVCRRLSKIDYVFSFLSVGIALQIFLGMTLFVYNCERLSPRPEMSYQLSFYLCWCASGMMLWAGTLSYLNQVRMWSYATPSVERLVSYLRWASRHHSVGWRLPRLVQPFTKEAKAPEPSLGAPHHSLRRGCSPEAVLAGAPSLSLPAPALHCPGSPPGTRSPAPVPPALGDRRLPGTAGPEM